jgi:hypothetical protein
MRTEAPADLRQRGAALIEGLRKAKVKQEPDVVEFYAGGFTPTLVRMRLAPEGAACLVGGGDDVQIAPREQVSLELEHESAKMAKGTLVVGSRRWKGQLKADHLARFRDWQAGAPGLAKAA